MSNKLYPRGKEYVLANGGLLNGAIKAVLLNTTNTDAAGTFYTQDDTHQFLSDIPVGARLSAGAVLTSKTVTLGIFNADPVTFPAVTGPTAEALALYLDTGVEATSPLIMYVDTVTGLPFLPSGADAQMVWDTGPYKIFAI